VPALVRQMAADAALARRIHAREGAPAVGPGPTPNSIRAGGRDLADLCSRVADVLVAASAEAGDGAGGRAATPAGEVREVLSLAAADDDCLVARWVAEIAARSGVRSVDVYHAGSGSLHALLSSLPRRRSAARGRCLGDDPGVPPGTPETPPVPVPPGGPVAAARPAVGALGFDHDGWPTVTLAWPAGQRPPFRDQA
jgi:hypothetical protein